MGRSYQKQKVTILKDLLILSSGLLKKVHSLPQEARSRNPEEVSRFKVWSRIYPNSEASRIQRSILFKPASAVISKD